MNLQEFFVPVDLAIRQGKLVEARKLLRPLVLEKAEIQRLKDLRTLAELCRRVGWQENAVRILHPVVRPSGRARWKLGPAELAEYAANLSFVGASAEALQILRELNSRQEPRALLFQAFALFGQWDYHQALPLLRTYCDLEVLTDYERQVGNINLLAALVNTGNFEECLERAESFIGTVPARSLLWTNALEIQAQAHIFMNSHDKAQRCFEQMAEAPHMRGAAYQLFIDKWRIFNELRTHGVSKSLLKQFDQVTELAREQKRWETVRDCGFLKAWASDDEELARMVFFGSPYPEYRRRIISRMEISVDIGDSFVWTLKEGRGGKSLDLRYAPVFLKDGDLPLRLLDILVSDFYRPQALASVAARLFPGEYYHPTHSLNKINQVLLRLRQTLDSEGLGLKVEWVRGALKLEALKPLSILVPHPEAERDEWAAVFSEGEWLSLDDIQARKALPRRSLQRKLQEALGQNLLLSRGETRSRRYARPISR